MKVRPPYLTTKSQAIYRKGGSGMEQLFGMIANMGFPIVVSVYLLVRIENRIESLAKSIQVLAQAISEMG
jgi:hypothetical protein